MTRTTEGARLTTANASDEAAWFGVAREHTELPVIARFTVEGEPRSKARPRLGRGNRTYTPEQTVAAEQAVGWAFRLAARSYEPDPSWQYGFVALFFSATRQRRDVDNMIKLVADGLNGVAWVDDSQVVEVSARKTFVRSKDEARTEVLVYRVGVEQPPTATCVQCGGEYRTYTSWTSKRKYCSPECRQAAAVERRRRPCPQCGEYFTSPKGVRYCGEDCRLAATNVELECAQCGRRFQRAKSVAAQQKNLCGDDCRTAYWREHRAKAARGTCEVCGGSTSKKTYRRCRACASEARRAT